MQSCHGFIEHPLHRRHERGVVLFGGFDRRMAEQELNSSKVRSIREQRDGECVAETMRMPVLDAGELHQAIDRAPRGSNCGREFSFPAPEKVERLNWASFQGSQGYFGQADVLIHSGLHRANQQPAVLHVKRGTLQLDGVGDAKPGVEKKQHQSPRPESGARNLTLVRIVDAIARRDNLIDLGLRKRHSGQVVDLGRPQLFGGVIDSPLPREAKFEKRSNRLKLFVRTAGCNPAGTAKFSQFFQSDSRNRAPIEIIRQVPERIGVANERGWLQFSSPAVVQEGVDCFVETRGMIDRLRFALLATLIELQKPRLGVWPIAGLHGSPLSLSASVVAVHPNRAGAFYVAYPQVLISTIRLVPTVKTVHGTEILSQIGYKEKLVWVQTQQVSVLWLVISELRCYKMGRLVGFEGHTSSTYQPLNNLHFKPVAPLAPIQWLQVRHGTEACA